MRGDVTVSVTEERSTAYGPEAPVPIFQHEWEFTQAIALFRERRPRAVLEVGTYHGGTLYHWLRNAQPGARVVSVDTFTAADNRHLFPDWKPDGVDLHVIQGDSRSPRTVRYAQQFGPYDWVFIDADHYEDAVRDDWANYGKPVKHGVVLFHDILTNPAHPEIEVGRLWDELKTEHRTEEFVANPNAAWGGIGVVYL